MQCSMFVLFGHRFSHRQTWVPAGLWQDHEMRIWSVWRQFVTTIPKSNPQNKSVFYGGFWPVPGFNFNWRENIILELVSAGSLTLSLRSFDTYLVSNLLLLVLGSWVPTSQCVWLANFWIFTPRILAVRFNYLRFSDESDHHRCCSLAGVERNCLGWCRGGLVDSPYTKHCLTKYAKKIMNCFRDDRGIALVNLCTIKLHLVIIILPELSLCFPVNNRPITWPTPKRSGWKDRWPIGHNRMGSSFEEPWICRIIQVSTFYKLPNCLEAYRALVKNSLTNNLAVEIWKNTTKIHSLGFVIQIACFSCSIHSIWTRQ